MIAKLEHDFRKAERVLIPDLGDWVAAGRILARIGSHYGFDQIGRGRLTNDALIAVSAARRGIRVLTANPKDFARIAEFHTLQWETI